MLCCPEPSQEAAHPELGSEGQSPTLQPAGATYTEDDALQGVLRLTEEPPADLWGDTLSGAGCLPHCSVAALWATWMGRADLHAPDSV